MRVLYVCLALFIAVPVASSPRSTSIPYYITNAARHFKVSPGLLYSICQVESRCTTTINHNDGTKDQKRIGIISKSYGMFQIKLSTAKSLGFTGKSHDLLNPEVNAFYAAKLLNHLYDKYEEDKAVISAYNAGKPIKSNRHYVKLVLTYYERLLK
jgi:soluble lytic murein transglycosylase-like protein